jgi:O-antigen ligase
MLIAILFSKRLNELRRWQTIHTLFFSFVIWITVSAIINGWAPASKTRVFAYWKMLVLFILIVTILENIDRAKKLGVFTCVLIIILAIEAIQHKFSLNGLGWAGQSLGWIDPDALAAGERGRSRWVGIFDGPGVFAVLFPVATSFLLGAFAAQKTKIKRIILIIIIALLSWALYCTGSRGGMIAMLIVFVLYFMLRYKFSFISILITIGLLVSVNLLAPAYITTIRDQSNSTQHRVEMWAEGMDMVKDSPIFGVGINTFKIHSGSLIAHNSSIEMMAETGIIGLMLWISMFYVSYKDLRARLSDTSEDSSHWFYLALFLALTGYLISAMFVTLEYETQYLLLAIIAAAFRKDHNPVTFTKRDAFNVFCISGVWIVFVQIFVIAF